MAAFSVAFTKERFATTIAATSVTRKTRTTIIRKSPNMRTVMEPLSLEHFGDGHFGDGHFGDGESVGANSVIATARQTPGLILGPADSRQAT